MNAKPTTLAPRPAAEGEARDDVGVTRTQQSGSGLGSAASRQQIVNDEDVLTRSDVRLTAVSVVLGERGRT